MSSPLRPKLALPIKDKRSECEGATAAIAAVSHAVGSALLGLAWLCSVRKGWLALLCPLT